MISPTADALFLVPRRMIMLRSSSTLGRVWDSFDFVSTEAPTSTDDAPTHRLPLPDARRPSVSFRRQHSIEQRPHPQSSPQSGFRRRILAKGRCFRPCWAEETGTSEPFCLSSADLSIQRSKSEPHVSSLPQLFPETSAEDRLINCSNTRSPLVGEVSSPSFDGATRLCDGVLLGVSARSRQRRRTRRCEC